MTPDDIIYSIPIADTHVDRYLKWLPGVAVLGCRRMGLTTANTFKRQLALLGLSTLVVKSVTLGLKQMVHRSRPRFPLDGRSFPSSHSSTAFSGAELLRQELHGDYPVLSWSGYVPAVATAVLRLSKRRHWPSDVLAGAAIGVSAVWFCKKIIDRVHKRALMLPVSREAAMTHRYYIFEG